MKVFFQAGLFAALIFLLGIMMGIWFDTFRLGQVKDSVTMIDISSEDARLLNNLIENFGKENCDFALKSNLAFNDRIFSEGREIEKKIEANVFTPDIEQQWRRYVILQLQFWMNSLALKEKCNFDYHIVLHLFKLEDRIAAKVDDRVQSSVMIELKEMCGSKIMLIPITTDVNLVSVDSIVAKYKITKFPAVVIDDNKVFQGVASLNKLKEVLGC